MHSRHTSRARRGFTLVELLITILVILLLASLSIPSYTRAREYALNSRAVTDVQTIQSEIGFFLANQARYPNTLAELGARIPATDPWGNPYQYLNFALVNGQGAMRKDRFLVPINSDYDLYSLGPDGQSMPPLNARVSRDDIIRANDGGYIGPARGF